MSLWIGFKSELTDLLARLQGKVFKFYTCLFIKIKANLKLIYNAKITSPLTSLNLHTEHGPQLGFAALSAKIKVRQDAYIFLFHTDTDTFEGRTSGLQLIPMRKRKEVLQFIRLLPCYLFLPHVSHRGRLYALINSLYITKSSLWNFLLLLPNNNNSPF